MPDQARNMVERVLEYDRRLGKERATIDGFLEDAEKHRQDRDPLEEEARHRVQQDPDVLVTDLPGYRSLPRIPAKLPATGRAIRRDEDTYGPHLDRIPGSWQMLAATLERMERYRLNAFTTSIIMIFPAMSSSASLERRERREDAAHNGECR